MSDLLEAFQREQEEAEKREQLLLSQLSKDVSSSPTSLTHRPSTSRTTSRSKSNASSSSSAAATVLSPNSSPSDSEDGDDGSFELRPLLWHLVSSTTPPSEHNELAHLLGRKQLQTNEDLDVELKALLSIGTASQLRNARKRYRNLKLEQQILQQSVASKASNQKSEKDTRPLSRQALPDSGARQFLSQEIQSLLLSLRAQGVRSGLVQEEKDLHKLLPRPETARQKRILNDMVGQLQKDLNHDPEQIPQQPPSSSSAATTSAPTSSRPSSGGLLTARPSSAALSRQRSLSTASSTASLSPADSGRDPSAVAAISALSNSLLSDVPTLSSGPASTATSSSTRPASASSTTSEGESHRQSIVGSLQRALKEEEQALLQDIAYLHHVLEEEVETAIEVEKERKQHKEKAAAISSSSQKDGSTATNEEIASVQELRALNTSLKAAVAAEEQRANTLLIMSAVGNNSNISVKPITHHSSASPSFSASNTSAGTPLKAVRLPSASRVRPPSANNNNGGPTAAYPVGGSRPGSGSTSSSPGVGSRSGTPGGTNTPLPSPLLLDGVAKEFASGFQSSSSRPQQASSASSSSQIQKAASPVEEKPIDLQDLMAENADLFSIGPSTSTSTASASAVPVIRPTIPTLALKQLNGEVPSSPLTKTTSYEERKESNGSSGVSSDHADASPGRASSRSIERSPEGASNRPLTARSASKARSRIQAAQQFHASPDS